MKVNREMIAAVLISLFVGSIVTSIGLTLVGRSQPAAIVITPAATAAPTATVPPSPTPGPVTVDVGGEVAQPGVYVLPAGSRVEDAIAAAGGYGAGADAVVVNLAQPLADGAKVTVPHLVAAQPTPEPYVAPALVVNTAVAANQATGETAVAGAGAATGLINLNNASRADLETLPGVGPSTAGKILDYRDENGHFNQIEDIMNVSGIGQAKFDKMQPYITVEN